MHPNDMREFTKRLMIWSFITAILITSFGMIVRAELVNIEGNNYFFQEKIPTGKTGQMMDITFTFLADKDYEQAYAGIAYDDQINSADSNKDNVSEVVAFPFELTSETTQLKSIGRLKEGQKKSITLRARVRRDVTDGYYGIQVYVTGNKDGGKEAQEYINVWIQKSTDTTKSTDEEVKNAAFVLGENQSTPYGVYPNVMNYSINLRNNGLTDAHDVTASLVLDKDNKVFPFDINEVSYNRSFQKIAVNETVSMDYSFMIRKDVYSGFYPIKMKIHYREKADGELKTFETEYYVNIKNKEEEKETTAKSELADKDRAKARIIVDSFQTIPEKIIAGQEFELIINMKNASSDLNASNILFAIESEKVSDSAVFSTLGGSNSFVVNKLDPGESMELRMKMTSKASVDQRSYYLKINEKFDSPQFKNAEESVNIDLNVHQIARLTIGNITLEPDSLNVGDEASLVFPVSNSGRVILYNVTAKLEAPFVKENEIYVGNIKPGETGNVDTLVSAIEANPNMEKAKIVIQYEDENGLISTEEKEIEFPVTEMIPDQGDLGIEETGETPVSEKKNPLITYGPIGAAAAAAAIGGTVFAIKRKKK